jgi:hypothetical protein
MDRPVSSLLRRFREYCIEGAHQARNFAVGLLVADEM